MDRFRHSWPRVGLTLVCALLLLAPQSAAVDASPSVLVIADTTARGAGGLAPDAASFAESPAAFRAARSDAPVSHPAALRATLPLTPTLFLPLIIGPAFVVRTPNPVDLTMTLDSRHATTATLPLSGGTLMVSEPTFAAGASTPASTTQFQLTIPPNVLLYTTTVVMTPISSVVGLSPTVHFIAGVHIEPEGLRLFNLATLIITPSVSVPVTEQVPIASSALGQSSYLYPRQLGTSQMVFSLMHFSDYTEARSDTGPIPAQYNQNNIPLSPEEQFMEAAAQLVQEEWVAQHTGQPGDPNFHQDFTNISWYYYESVLLPRLSKAYDDCDNASAWLLPAITWARQMEVDGFGDDLAAEITNVGDRSLSATQHCWSLLKCVHRNLRSEFQRVLSLARELQLMDISGQYDPSSLPECPCATITSKTSWSGEMTLSYNRTVSSGDEQVTVNESSGGSAQLTGPTFAGNLSGSASASYSDYINGQLVGSYRGGPLVPFTPPSTGSHITLYLHPNTCTYLFSIGVKATVTWNDNSHTVADVGTVVSGEHPLSDYNTDLIGGADVPAHSAFYVASSNLDNDYFVANQITDVAGESAGGLAQVTWIFTRGP